MPFDNKLCVVTGGSGFVGTHMAKTLAEQGAKLRIVLHRNAMKLDFPSAEFVTADLSDQQQARAAFQGAHVVFHCAGAVSAAGVTVNNPMSAITANLVLTANVLEAAWHCKTEKVQIFGSSTGYPVSSHPIREDEMWSGPTHPSYFGYGWMRRYLERMGEFVNDRSATKVIIVRPTATYGRFDDFRPESSHVVPALIRKACERLTPYEVWGTGDEIRDFLHIEDLVRGCVLATEKLDTADPVNIGYGQIVTIREIVTAVLKAAGHDAEIQFDPTKPTTIPVRMVDCSKAEKLLGFRPRISLQDGIADTVNWYKQQAAKGAF